ncbi:SAVED domain-containing protein, partial [Cytobacillus firmus]
MMKLVQTVTELFILIQSDPFTAIITLLILVFSSILLYKKFGLLQIVYNWIINNILRFMKREYVMLTTFSKKEANYSKIKEKYQEQGCLFLTLNVIKLFEVDGSIKKENLLKILKKQRKRMKVAIKRGNNSNSLIYLGFPHVPLAFLDGYHFKDTDNPILFEYQGEDAETLGKGFYELNKKYNTDMKIVSNYNEQNSYGNEVAIKIEQSF